MGPLRALCLFVYIVVTTVSYSQVPDGLDDYGQILFQPLTIQDGLSNNDVVDIITGKNGFLWIATRNGLDRFDGLQMKHYKYSPYDPASLSNNRIISMYKDLKDEIWIHTYDEKVNKYIYENDAFVHFAFDSVPEDVRTSLGKKRSLYSRETIVQDTRGKQWSMVNGSISFDSSFNTPGIQSKYLQIPGVNRKDVRQIYIDNQNVLWVATANTGIHKAVLDRKKFNKILTQVGNNKSILSNKVRSITMDEDGIFWIGIDNNGILQYNPLTEERKEYLATDDSSGIFNNNIRELFFDSSGYLWIGSIRGGGLSRFDRSTNTFKHYKKGNTNKGLPSDRVYTIKEDKYGSLWVGTFAGISILKQNSTEFIHHLANENKPGGLGYRRVREIFQDHAGVFWIATEKGLYKVLMPDGDYENMSFESFTKAKYYDRGLMDDFVFTIHESEPGILWLGTANGLVRMDVADTTFNYYGLEDGLVDVMIYKIESDERGNLWMSHNRGLTKLDVKEKAFTNFTSGDGLQEYGFSQDASFKDKKGNLYFGGNSGITHFHPNDIIKNPYPPKVAFTDFKISNESIEINQKVRGDVILNKSITETKQITLSPRHKTFTFEFVALHHLNPKENQYAYMLKGYDKDWNITDASKRYATYSNLPGGTYTFMVKASNSDGIWSDSPKKIKIQIIPPFWQTWWFRVLAILFIVLIVLVVFRLRLKGIKKRNDLLKEEINRRQVVQEALEAKNTELERFTYTVSHDLKSPLITINGFLGMVREDVIANDMQALENDIQTIEDATNKMRNLLDDLLEISRIGQTSNQPERVEANDLVNEVLSLFEKSIKNNKITVKVTTVLPALNVDKTRVFEVFQNLVENAIKYMGNGNEKKIEIGTTELDNNTTFYIRDTGLGIKPEFCERVFELFERLSEEIEGTGIGLAITKRVVESHHGKIWVESEGEGKGSTFYFTLPIEHEALPV